MRWISIVTAGAILCSVTAMAGPSEEDAWKSLVTAERAFSDDCAARGVRASFLAHFEPGVLTFPPGKSIRVGTAHLTAGPQDTSVLTWQPVVADVSTAGDLGYTTGPWELRAKKGDVRPAATGSFVSVWRRRPGGEWKVLADFGHNGPHPADALKDPVPPQPRRPLKKPSPTPAEPLTLAEVDFDKAAARNTPSAYEKYLADEIRFYRDGAAPILGKEAALKTVTTVNATISWKNERSRISDGNDLGYTAGTMVVQRRKPAGIAPDYMKYLRIWRNEGGNRWRVVLEIANAAPPAEE